MKRLIAVLFVVLLAGCAGFQLNNDLVTNGTAYASGRFMFYAVDQYAPNSLRALELRYNDFMDATKDMEEIPPEISMSLYNDMITILSREIDDPYGITGDLNFFMIQCGGQFVTNEEGQKILTAIKAIPRNLYVSFQFGWINSKRTKEAQQA